MKIDGKEVPIENVVAMCKTAAYVFNRAAPLFNLTPRDEDKLIDYFMDTISGVFDRIPEQKP